LIVLRVLFTAANMINTHDTAARSAATKLSIRVSEGNRLHHLWNNNGTWWLHYTEHLADFTKRRIRRSLRTHDLELAIRRRDEALGSVAA
jgi:hypothetical protein